MNRLESILVPIGVHRTSAVSVHLFRLSLVACSSTFYREEFQEIEGRCLAIGRRYCSLIREPDGASWDSICTYSFSTQILVPHYCRVEAGEVQLSHLIIYPSLRFVDETSSVGD